MSSKQQMPTSFPSEGQSAQASGGEYEHWEHLRPDEKDSETIVSMIQKSCSRSGCHKFINETPGQMRNFIRSVLEPLFDPSSGCPSEEEYRACEVWTSDAKEEGGKTKAVLTFALPDKDYSKSSSWTKQYSDKDGRNSTEATKTWLTEKYAPMEEWLDNSYRFPPEDAINISFLSYKSGEEGELEAKNLLKRLKRKSKVLDTPVCGRAYNHGTALVYRSAGFEPKSQWSIQHGNTESQVTAYAYDPRVKLTEEPTEKKKRKRAGK